MRSSPDDDAKSTIRTDELAFAELGLEAFPIAGSNSCGSIVKPLTTGYRAERTLRFHCNSRPIITFEDLIFDVDFVESSPRTETKTARVAGASRNRITMA